MLSNHLILCCPLLLLPSTFPTRLPWHLSWWRICLQCRRPQFSSWIRKIPEEGIGYPPQYSWASLVAQLVKNPPAMQETWVSSLGWADPLEKGKATHSTFWAWRIPWTVSSMGSQRVGHSWETFTHFPQHWGLFHWVVSSHQVTKVLELHHQSSQWYSRLISFKIDWVFYKLLSVFCY